MRRLIAVLLPLTVACASQGSSDSTKPEDSSKSQAATKEKPKTAATKPAKTSEKAVAHNPSLTPPARKSDADRKSKNGMLEAEIGGVPVLVQYGRPTVRDRKVFGELVPYGKIWRTGADEATTITLKSPAMVEGKAVPAGTFALFTIPGEDKWTIVLNAVSNQWGAYKYDKDKDILRVEVTPMKGEATEALTFSAEEDTLVLSWATTKVPVKIAKQG